MIETPLNKVLNTMRQYVENIYEHDSEPMLNWKDIKLVLDEIERLSTELNTCMIERNQFLSENERLNNIIFKAHKMIYDNYGLLDKYGIDILDDILTGKELKEGE